MKNKSEFAMLWSPAVYDPKTKQSKEWTEDSIMHGIDYFTAKYHIIPDTIIVRNPEKLSTILKNLVGINIIASNSVADAYIVIASSSEAYFSKERENAHMPKLSDDSDETQGWSVS